MAGGRTSGRFLSRCLVCVARRATILPARTTLWLVAAWHSELATRSDYRSRSMLLYKTGQLTWCCPGAGREKHHPNFTTPRLTPPGSNCHSLPASFGPPSHVSSSPRKTLEPGVGRDPRGTSRVQTASRKREIKQILDTVCAHDCVHYRRRSYRPNVPPQRSRGHPHLPLSTPHHHPVDPIAQQGPARVAGSWGSPGSLRA